jgi:hypothetical protein
MNAIVIVPEMLLLLFLVALLAGCLDTLAGGGGLLALPAVSSFDYCAGLSRRVNACSMPGQFCRDKKNPPDPKDRGISVLNA